MHLTKLYPRIIKEHSMTPPTYQIFRSRHLFSNFDCRFECVCVCVCRCVRLCVCVNLMKLLPCYSVLHWVPFWDYLVRPGRVTGKDCVCADLSVCVCRCVQLCVCVNLIKFFPCYSVLHWVPFWDYLVRPGRGYRERLCVC